jgi:hypothetical protein
MRDPPTWGTNHKLRYMHFIRYLKSGETGGAARGMGACTSKAAHARCTHLTKAGHDGYAGSIRTNARATPSAH